MVEKLFKESLKLAEQLRPKFIKSLGGKVDGWKDVFRNLNISIPDLFTAIYSNVSGIKRDISQQDLMDFIPGYRLIHISEFIHEVDNMRSVLRDEKCMEYETVLPILANYSSDFICYCKRTTGEELICSLMNDIGELIVMHNSLEKFLETICEFYKQGVYFLDSDGYLDYDMNREGIIGSAINPGVKYWTE